MNFYLQPAYLSRPPALEITESEYQTLKHSSSVLNAAFSFEENYDLLIGNYLEFEATALSISTTSLARQLTEYQELFELKSEINRRAVNFLSSARLFVDQLPQRVSLCGMNAEDALTLLRKEYGSSFEYRFMEALRNHVQHSGSAIHGFSVGSDRMPSYVNGRIVSSTEVNTEKRFICLDSKFKKTVLDECPDKVDTLIATRRYLESLSTVHDICRDTINQSIILARDSFLLAISRYKEFSTQSSNALTAYSSSSGTPIEGIPIFLKWDDVREKLSNRNRKLYNLSKRLISSGSL